MQVFWLGDLNYRLADLDCGEVKELLAEGNIAVLQEQVDGGVMVSSTHPRRSSEQGRINYLIQWPEACTKTI